MAEQILQEAVVHVRFDGESRDVPLSDLDLGPQNTDAAVRRAVAGYLGVAEGKLRDYVIDRHETGNLTVRPQAVFG
jgi:hypothetical protein